MYDLTTVWCFSRRCHVRIGNHVLFRSVRFSEICVRQGFRPPGIWVVPSIASFSNATSDECIASKSTPKLVNRAVAFPAKCRFFCGRKMTSHYFTGYYKAGEGISLVSQQGDSGAGRLPCSDPSKPKRQRSRRTQYVMRKQAYSVFASHLVHTWFIPMIYLTYHFFFQSSVSPARGSTWDWVELRFPDKPSRNNCLSTLYHTTSPVLVRTTSP